MRTTAITLLILLTACVVTPPDPDPAPAVQGWHAATEHDADLVARLSAYLGRSSSTAVADPDLCSDDGGTCCTFSGADWCCCSFTLGCRCHIDQP